MSRLKAARSLALRLSKKPWTPPAPDGRKRQKFWVLGDPQAPLDRVLASLDAAGLLGPDGWLRKGAGLLSVGDHFDHALPKGMSVEDSAREGLALLQWLASHPPDQVVLLGGNHDLSRVMELATFTDTRWAAAWRWVERWEAAGKPSTALPDFQDRFHEVPAPGLVNRDWKAFSEAQQRLVQQLLLAGRMRLAAVGERDGAQVLVTHAGLTRREVALLPGHPRTAEALASALNAHLDAAVAAVAPAWRRGRRVPLSLHPLNVTGTSGQESGGLLNHRPTVRGAEEETPWHFNPRFPRRFEPHALPKGLVQAAGHVSHGKCQKALAPYADDSALVEFASVRTLSVRSKRNGRYRVGVHPPAPGEATLYLVDPSFSTSDVVKLDWLVLGAVTAPR